MQAGASGPGTNPGRPDIALMQSPESLRRGEEAMVDLLFVVITVVFFAANVAFAYGCDELMGGSR